MPFNPYHTYNQYNSFTPYNSAIQQPFQGSNNNQGQPQLQNGGVVIVQNEKEAQDYLVANGTSVTFIDMNARKIYVKTKGFSTFDVPVFESYSLVKDIDNEANDSSGNQYASKAEMEMLRSDLEKLKANLTSVKEISNE